MLPIALCATALSATAFDIDSEALRIAAATPTLQAAKAEAEAELEEARAENVLEGLEAEFEYKFAPKGIVDRWGFSIGQNFQFPGVYAARNKENKLRQGAFEMLYTRELMDKVFEVKLAIIRLIEARATKALVDEAAANVDRLCSKYREALQRGETTILELRKIELQQFKMMQQCADADAECDAASYALQTLCAGTAMPEIPSEMNIPELKPYDLCRQAMIDANPSLAYESLMAEAEAAAVATAKRSALPSFRLAYIHDYEESMHFNGFGISIALPSWNNKHNVNAARARAFAAEQVLSDSRLRADAEFSAGYAAAERLKASVDRGATLLCDADYPKYLTRALDAGRINLFTYLTEYNDFLAARMSFIALQGKYARSEANISRFVANVDL